MQDIPSPIGGYWILFLFIVINGILHAFRSAVQNVRETEIQEQKEDGKKKAGWILKFLTYPNHLGESIQWSFGFLNILLGYFCFLPISSRLYRYIIVEFGGLAYIKFLAIVICLLSLLVFYTALLSVSVFVPRVIGRQSALSTSYLLVRIVCFFVVLLRPFTWMMEVLSKIFVRLLGLKPLEKLDVTEEEIINIVDEAQEQGLIMDSEAEMIQNIIQFGDISAKDIMTHRMNINALDAEISLDEAIQIMVDESNSRYPVFLEDIDNIIGIIHVKDAIRHLTKHDHGSQKLKEIHGLIRTVGFIPETKSIDAIFQEMQQKKIHMSIVVDEYGQTSGLVAMEDILEEIVGDILDEYDEDDNFIQEQVDKSVLIDGLTPLEQVGEVLGIEFEEDVETLNGYLTLKLEHIPTSRDRFIEGDGYSFEILGVANHVIQKVKVKKIEEEDK
ncbi:MAG TPA: hemolysin family protein [Lachnospiraceae bacterium]